MKQSQEARTMTLFEKDYFVGGTKSNFKDYRMRKFDGLARDLSMKMTTKLDLPPELLEIREIGSATGALIHQLLQLGYKHIKGTDISNWAVEYGRKTFDIKDQLKFYDRNILDTKKILHFIIFLDVLEHMPDNEIEFFLEHAHTNTAQYLIIRVPVSAREGEDYVLEVSRNDKTHLQVHSKQWWDKLLQHNGYEIDEILHCENIYESEGVFARIYRRQNV